jgi:hypothetical protein
MMGRLVSCHRASNERKIETLHHLDQLQSGPFRYWIRQRSDLVATGDLSGIFDVICGLPE